jgi:hypothetical protein
VEERKEMIESISDVDEKIVFPKIQEKVHLSSVHQKENKEMAKLFLIKIQIKKKKIPCWKCYTQPKE